MQVANISLGYLAFSASGDGQGSEEHKGDLLAGYLQKYGCRVVPGQIVVKRVGCLDGFSGDLLACPPTMEVG